MKNKLLIGLVVILAASGCNNSHDDVIDCAGPARCSPDIYPLAKALKVEGALSAELSDLRGEYTSDEAVENSAIQRFDFDASIPSEAKPSRLDIVFTIGDPLAQDNGIPDTVEKVILTFDIDGTSIEYSCEKEACVGIEAGDAFGDTKLTETSLKTEDGLNEVKVSADILRTVVTANSSD